MRRGVEEICCYIRASNIDGESTCNRTRRRRKPCGCCATVTRPERRNRREGGTTLSTSNSGKFVLLFSTPQTSSKRLRETPPKNTKAPQILKVSEEQREFRDYLRIENEYYARYEDTHTSSACIIFFFLETRSERPANQQDPQQRASPT